MASKFAASLASTRKKITNNRAIKLPFQIYGAAVILATLYGAGRGIYNWSEWYYVRQPMKIKYKTVEPVVNVARDAGHMAYQVSKSIKNYIVNI